MSDDLELIKQLEKEIGIKLETVHLGLVGKRVMTAFAVDPNGYVKGLSICEVKLTDVPAVLPKLQRLEKLDLYGNQICDISSLKGLKGLTTLILSGNQIRDISSLKELKGLTSLSLWDNQISDISSLKELKGLILLRLNSNQISDISSLKELKWLAELYLHRNQIRDISSLKELKNLKYLTLVGNKIYRLPAKLLDLGMEIKWKMYGGAGIFLQENPLVSPPVEIVTQGNEAIRQYFKSMEGKEQALNEVKILLVGDGAAGKTSLVKQLLGHEFDKNESPTHGININPWYVTVENTYIKVHLWDFGGQEIMHATHQFFLSKRSLYILVLDGRKDEKTEYWLNHIKSFGGDSPIIVVLNKIDQNPGFDVNRRFLKEKHPNVKGFYPISCADGTGIDHIKNILTKELAAVELIRTIWPNSWFNVKKQLEDMKEHFIDYHRYQQICAGENIESEETRDTLVDFLNDLGVILHFKEFHLEDTHVLEPKWLTNAVYKIINSKLLSDSKGVLELRRMGEILKPQPGEETVFLYPPDKYRYIFQLMKKFELCYGFDEEEKILVPDLLEVGEPPMDFDYVGALKFRVKYNFLPRSVMPRFIVRRHRDIKGKLRWRTGVVLENPGFDATAVVKSDEMEKTIHIYITGSQRRDYLAVILDTLRKINGSFEKIEVDECVPLPDNPLIAVNYLHLLRLERMGQLEFFPEKAKRQYIVKELLEGIKPEKERQKEVEQLLKEKNITLNFSPTMISQLTAEQYQQTRTEVHTEVNVDINISVDLPALQADFEELKDLLIQLDSAGKGKLKELGADLDALTSKSEPAKLSGPLNRLGRFLKKLGDEKSEYHKLLKGAKTGLEAFQKVGRTYNKFAHLLGLPSVPGILLGPGVSARTS